MKGNLNLSPEGKIWSLDFSGTSDHGWFASVTSVENNNYSFLLFHQKPNQDTRIWPTATQPLRGIFARVQFA